MRFLQKNGDLVLVWSGISVFIVATLMGLLVIPVGAEVLSPHNTAARAIQDHIYQGSHSGALTITEAMMAWTAFSGLGLALVGAVYRTALTRMETHARDISQIRTDLTALQGDHREFSGEIKATLGGIDRRLEGFSITQAQQMQNMIEIMGKITAGLDCHSSAAAARASQARSIQ